MFSQEQYVTVHYVLNKEWDFKSAQHWLNSVPIAVKGSFTIQMRAEVSADHA